MKSKHLLLLFLLMALFTPWTARAQSTVTIGDGMSTDRVMPINTWYGYSFSEIIYPAADLVADGTIHSISFYHKPSGSVDAQTNDIVLYMKNVTRSTFADKTDYEAVNTSDIVFQGPWTIPAEEGWSTITLDTPFAFDGVSNLMIAIDENTDGYSSRYFAYTNVSNSGIGFYSDSYNPDPYDLESFSGNSSVRYQRPNMRVSITYTTVPCFLPTDLAASNITFNSAELSWVEQGAATGWVLEYGTAADFTGATSATVNGTPSYPLTGLTAGTIYYFRVKADCDSDWATSRFATKQVAVAVGNDWSDDFEGNANWMLFNPGNDNDWYIGRIIDTTNVSNILFVSNDNGATNAYTTSGLSVVYATKLMTFENAQYTFDFDWKANGESSWDYLRAFLIPDTVNIIPNLLPSCADNNTSTFSSETPAGWIDFGGGKLNLKTTWQTASEAVNVTAGDYYVAFMWVNDGSGGSNPPAAVDNFSIAKVACPTPENFIASDVTNHTAALSWDGANAEAWQIVLTDDADAIPDTLTAIDVTETTYALTGLAAETHFNAYVRTVCGEDYTEWVSTDFTTLVACLVPASLSCTGLTSTSATFSWTENGTATSWDLQYSTDNTFATYTSVQVDDEPSVEITDLTPDTIYYARVQAVCGGEDGVSAFSNVVSFEPTEKIVIGTAQTTNTYLPTYTFYNYSLTQQIYTVEELGDEVAAIMSIDFYCTGERTRDLDIYMVSTDKSSFTGTSDWITVTNADLVYSGEVTFLANAWTSIVFTNPFVYDGENNVALIVDDNTGSYVSGPSFKAFNATSQAIRIYSDGTDYDPFDPTSYAGTVLNVKNHVRLLLSDPNCMIPTQLTAVAGAHSAELSWTSDGEAWQICVNGDENNLIDVNSTQYTMDDLDASTEYTVKVRVVCGDDQYSDWATLTFTTDVSCHAPTNLTIEPTPFSATVAWTSDNDSFDVWYREFTDPNNDFEFSSLLNWTTIDADGDGFGWVLGSECGGIYLVENGSLAGYGHDDSNDLVTSGSYSNFTNLALTPDNYLVSPQINLGGSITFWAQAQDAGYPEEHFGVAVSTTVNDDVDAFTTIQEWTMTSKGTGAKANPGTTRSGNRSQGSWYQYTVDLSDYAGETGYVAIRHFNCTDEFLLNVDDIVIEQPNYVEPEWIQVTANDTTCTITGLSPETAYEVKVRSNCGDEGYSLWAFDLFVTLEACGAPTDLAYELNFGMAELSWTGFTETFNIQYREVDPRALDAITDKVNTWTLVEGVEGNHYTILGLKSEATYEAKVQGVNCDGEGTTTEWSDMVTFTTEEFSVFTKEIAGYGNGNGGWYLIASPLAEAFAPTEYNGFITNVFDLYRFNQEADYEWENWKTEGDHFHFDIEPGKGYLYANSADTTLTFAGTPNTETEQTVDLVYEEGHEFSGWNLVGNPFADTAYIDRPFYFMNNGEEIIAAGGVDQARFQWGADNPVQPG